jgi:hypothetical protein
MTIRHRAPYISLATAALLLPTLACRAATRLIIPDTPTPLPPTPTLTPTPIPSPTFTPTPVIAAGCPVLTSDILNTAANFDFGEEGNADDEIYLVTYDANGNIISNPYYEESVPDELKDEQRDRSTHEAIWNYFVRLIPREERDFLTQFSIVTDGNGNILAAVGQTNDPKEWVLEVDILDSSNQYVLTVSLLHEFAHLLTLNSTQVPPSIPVFNNPNSDEIYQREVDACSQYFPGEGCSNPNSYINQFFDRFWPDLYAEWQEIDAEEDEDTYYDLLDHFYETYEDQFLSEYAPTSPAEDIAESFTYFVLAPKPESASIADEKISFFYEFPELVELRGQILGQLCAEFPQ